MALIDRRLDGKNKSTVNRQRFIRRFKNQIKKAVTEAMSGRSITDIDAGEKVNIPRKDMGEPIFSHGPGGRREMIHPGNKEFVVGDRAPRPSGGQSGGGGQASNSGEGEDDFTFDLSREEFLELFFDDLELPNLVKTQLAKVTEFKSVRAGFVSQGPPSAIHVVRSLRGSLARRIAMTRSHKKRIREIEDEMKRLQDLGVLDDDPRMRDLVEELEQEWRKVRAVPFIDTFDLRYTNRVKQPQPTTQAVMFCIMDVSGSMDQMRKDLAKRFMTLLYLFLRRNYEKVEVVFIRHHAVASEVDEHEFFHSRETGGTIVSTALVLMEKIIADRYPISSWNIYVAQASDGDNWGSDLEECKKALSRLVSCIRYFAYIETKPYHHQNQDLWEVYNGIREQYPEYFATRRVNAPADIYPVFRDLFKKRRVGA